MKNDIGMEAFLAYIALEKKVIKLPKREIDAKKEKKYFGKLLIDNLITRETYDNKIREIDSLTLNDKMHRVFCKLLRAS